MFRAQRRRGKTLPPGQRAHRNGGRGCLTGTRELNVQIFTFAPISAAQPCQGQLQLPDQSWTSGLAPKMLIFIGYYIRKFRAS